MCEHFRLVFWDFISQKPAKILVLFRGGGLAIFAGLSASKCICLCVSVYTFAGLQLMIDSGEDSAFSSSCVCWVPLS